MDEYLQSIKGIEITRSRRKEQDSPCSKSEITEFLGLTGSLNFLGHGSLPQASFVASHLQQLVGDLRVKHLTTANKAFQEIKDLSTKVTFLSPSTLSDPTYLAFSDASVGKSAYGQTGYISGIYFPDGNRRLFHAIDWLSCKQQRICFSSIGAKILAAAASTDRASLLAERLQEILKSTAKLPFTLTVDSFGLYSTITTLHEGNDYRLRPTVARMRDSFEADEISTMQWIKGVDNIADALTKRNLSTYQQLSETLNSGSILDRTLSSAKREKFSS